MTDQSESATEQFGRMLMAAAAGLALVTVSLWGPVLEKAHGVWRWLDDRR